jgi:hypothetical protein
MGMETATETKSVSEAIESYVALLQKQHDEYNMKHYPNSYTEPGTEKFSVTNGRRFAKIVRSDAGGYGGSAVAFIDKATGDIYKPDGWAKPAKHRRGNVLSLTNGMEAMTPSGR